jgi:protein-L-isoaspartate O-methyltransferase
MVRHHQMLLSVARMERILARDPFYQRLGTNGFERVEETPKFTRVALRVYIARLRQQISKALSKGGSMVLPEDALISETTDSNVVVHRINLPVEIVHRTMKLM